MSISSSIGSVYIAKTKLSFSPGQTRIYLISVVLELEEWFHLIKLGKSVSRTQPRQLETITLIA